MKQTELKNIAQICSEKVEMAIKDISFEVTVLGYPFL